MTDYPVADLRDSGGLGAHRGRRAEVRVLTTGLAFLGGLGLTLAIANAWVKRQWKKHRDLPTAKIV